MLWIEPLAVVPPERGEFQVTIPPVPYDFAPYGIVSFPLLTTVGERLTVLNGIVVDCEWSDRRCGSEGAAPGHGLKGGGKPLTGLFFS